MKIKLYDILVNRKSDLIDSVTKFSADYSFAEYLEGFNISYSVYVDSLIESIKMVLFETNSYLCLKGDYEYKEYKQFDFIVKETRKLLYQGIKAPIYLGFIKKCRKAFIQTVRFEKLNSDEAIYALEFLDNYFDMLEIYLCKEWTSTQDERKMAEIESLNSEMYNEKSKYISIFESSSNPTLLLNIENRIDCINLAARQLLASMDKKIYKDNVFIDKELHILKREIIQFMLSPFKEVTFEKELIINQASSYYQVSLIKMFNFKGVNSGVIVILNDITKVHKIEETTLQLATIVESSDDAIIGMDLDGTVINWNKGAENIYGYSLTEIKGSNICCIVRQERHQYVHMALQRIATGQSIEQIESVDMKKDGTPINVLIKASPIKDHSGRVIGVSTITRDMTKRKRAEDAEKLLMEAVEYEKIKNEFFANISHEFRTPINVIYSSLQMIDLHVKKDSSIENVSKYTKVMKQNCYRLLRLIRNLIDITRMDVGFFKLNLKNYDIISIVENITLSIVEYCNAKNINLIFDTEIEECTMACDPDMIERIMLNLFSNAIKFTGDNGNINVYMKKQEDNIVISVKDDGKGIEESKQKVVFERFMQADKSLSRENEGSGIGLAIVKELVELHKGTIEMQSIYGKGTELIIRMPIRRAVEDGESRTAPAENAKVEAINIEFSDIYL